MLRTYKRNGKLWRYEEGEQPADAVLAEVPTDKGAPEQRAKKAAAKRGAKAKEG